MEDKYNSNEFQDSLDDLENDFNSVMSNIANDDKMAKFSGQYKKLLDAFVSSHKNNSELVEKCRVLNTEIVQNSTKVNSVLSLSQDDQRTIAGLKFEFEKAWKMVEISQAKEEKSRETIETLKFEAKKLSKLAEEGGTNAFLDNNSLENIQDNIDELKKEIDVQNVQLKAITSEMDNWRSEIDKLNEEKNALNAEMETSSEQLATLREEAKKVEDEVSTAMKDVHSMKDEISANNGTIDGFPTKFSEARMSLDEVRRTKENNRQELREYTEMCAQSHQRVDVAAKMLENRQQSNNKVLREIESMKMLIKEKDDYIVEFQDSTKDSVNAYNVNDSDLKALTEMREKIRESLIKTRDRMTECRKEIFRLQHENLRIEGDVMYAKRSVSLAQHIGSKMKAEVYKEKKNNESAEGETTTVFNDIAQMKITKHSDLEKTQAMLQEIEKHSADTSEFLSNTLVAENQRNKYEEKRKELEVQYNGITNRIHKVNNLQKSLIEDRDLTRRQLEVLKQEAKEIENDNRTLLSDIQSSKEMIRQKDIDCIQIHREREEIREVIPDLEKRKAKEESNLKEITVQISTKYNELVRSRYYHDVSETSAKHLDISVKSLKTVHHAHESQVNKRHEEVGALREKIKALQWNISTEAGQYKKIVNKVEELKAELILNVNQSKKLINQSRHSDALRKELLRTEKIILQLRGRVKALEDEMETPINVHRWRFLEGTNPEQLSLIKMVQSLRDTLMVKLTQIQRLKETLERTKVEADIAMKKAKRENKEEREVEINYYEDILHKKNQQLRAVRESIRHSTSTVTEGRDVVSNVRNMLRDVKVDYFKLKQETSQMRASSQIQETKKLNNELKPKFIGGGFGYSKPLSALGESISSSAASPTNISSVIRSSHIVIPNTGGKSVVHNLLGKKKTPLSALKE